MQKCIEDSGEEEWSEEARQWIGQMNMRFIRHPKPGANEKGEESVQ
jgi:hypothetical protein